MLNVLLVGLALTVAAPEAKKEAPKKEEQKVEGVWLLEKLEAPGAPKDLPVDSMKFIFKDGAVDVQFMGKGKNDPAKYTVDYTKTPIEINIDPPGDKKAPGIVKFEGDKMHLCFSEGGDRPKEFKGDNKIVYVILKRVEEKK
jgi:uncharacterized protein (TIGR03067 family)